MAHPLPCKANDHAYWFPVVTVHDKEVNGVNASPHGESDGTTEA